MNTPRVSWLFATVVVCAATCYRNVCAQTSTTQFEYDANGNLTSVTDALGRVINLRYDTANRRIQQTLPAPEVGIARPTITYDYDGQDQLTSVRDPRNLATKYVIDGLGNQIGVDSPDSGATKLTVNLDGQPSVSKNARGQLVKFDYDSLGRVIRISYDSGIATTFDYNAATGRLSKVTDESGTTNYSYNQIGLLVNKVQSIIGSNGIKQFSTGYTYGTKGKTLGKIDSIIYPSGNRLFIEYGEDGRQSAVMLSLADGSTPVALMRNIQYQPFNQVESWEWGDSKSAFPNYYKREFNLQGQVTSLPLGHMLKGGALQKLFYDAAGRLVKTEHTGEHAIWLNQSYAYDGLDHLTGFINSTNTVRYQYDASGNRTQLAIGTQSYANKIDPVSNRLQSIVGPSSLKTYRYDAEGNRLTDETTSYLYSARGRLQSAQFGNLTTYYSYNGLNQRVMKTGPRTEYFGGATYFTYNESGQLIGEYDANGTLIEETIYLDNLPVAVVKTTTATNQAGDGIYHVYADQLGTPRVITRRIDNKIVWRWDNTDPFGVSQPDENPTGDARFSYNLRFPGQYYDRETNLYYNYYRDYDPQTGKYIQPDPIGLAGGINTYGYSLGNPISYSDPFGLAPPGAQNDLPGIGFLKAIFPHPEKAPIPIFPDDVPGTGDPCVQKYLDNHYPGWMVWIANFGNMQQYTQEDPGAGLHIAAEKMIITQGPGAVGARLVTAVPGSLAIGNRVGVGLIGTTTVLSGAAELAGAALTPFGTTAMAIAREACTCHQK